MHHCIYNLNIYKFTYFVDLPSKKIHKPSKVELWLRERKQLQKEIVRLR